MNTSLARLVYIAQVDQDYFDVAFNCPPHEFPWGTSKARKYNHISRASLARLNHLVYLPPAATHIDAHLVPYVCLWVTFPPKAAPVPVRPITRFPRYTPDEKS